MSFPMRVITVTSYPQENPYRFPKSNHRAFRLLGPEGITKCAGCSAYPYRRRQSLVPTPYKYSVRIVIQRIGSEPNTQWRILSFGGNREIACSEFASAQPFLAALRDAIPDFDQAKLLLPVSGNDATSIVFNGGMELNYLQLSAIGLG
jgi:hypothetical protein